MSLGSDRRIANRARYVVGRLPRLGVRDASEQFRAAAIRSLTTALAGIDEAVRAERRISRAHGGRGSSQATVVSF